MHPLWWDMSERLLCDVLTPEGPHGGGTRVSTICHLLKSETGRLALEFMRMLLMKHALEEDKGMDTPCRSLLYNVGGPIYPGANSEGASINILVGKNYPALIINGYMSRFVPDVNGVFGVYAEAKTVWIACHRFMCWLCNGPSQTDKVVVHHLCENKSCINPQHLQWVTASENNAWPNETVGRKRSASAVAQNRSPGSKRFRRRCTKTNCSCCTLSSVCP
jgi:HNH endonuclease